jgi:hypothetical protein
LVFIKNDSIRSGKDKPSFARPLYATLIPEAKGYFLIKYCLQGANPFPCRRKDLYFLGVFINGIQITFLVKSKSLPKKKTFAAITSAAKV